MTTLAKKRKWWNARNIEDEIVLIHSGGPDWEEYREYLPNLDTYGCIFVWARNAEVKLIWAMERYTPVDNGMIWLAWSLNKEIARVHH